MERTRLVTAEPHVRAHGVDEIRSVGASALPPSIFALVSDAVGPAAAPVVVTLVVLIAIPLMLVLRSATSASAIA